MKIIDKIIKGNLPPKSTEVLWYNITDDCLYNYDAKVGEWVKAYVPTKTSDLVNDSGFVVSQSVTTIWKGTQEEYDAIEEKDPNTFYIVYEPDSDTTDNSEAL